MDTVELRNDPYLRERQMIVDIEHPARGKISMPGCAVKLEDSPVTVVSALLGQHTRRWMARCWVSAPSSWSSSKKRA